MYNVVARIFQKITTEHTGAKSEEDRIMTIKNIELKHMKQN
jgi:hypothetical protein